LFLDDEEEALRPSDSIEDPVIIIDSDDEWFILYLKVVINEINKKNMSSFVSLLFRIIYFAFPKVLKYNIMQIQFVCPTFVLVQNLLVISIWTLDVLL
jgi:hypothetical protein